MKDEKLLDLEESFYVAKEEFLAAVIAFSQEPGSVPVKELATLAKRVETRRLKLQQAQPVEYAQIIAFPRKIA